MEIENVNLIYDLDAVHARLDPKLADTRGLKHERVRDVRIVARKLAQIGAIPGQTSNAALIDLREIQIDALQRLGLDIKSDLDAVGVTAMVEFLNLRRKRVVKRQLRATKSVDRQLFKLRHAMLDVKIVKTFTVDFQNLTLVKVQLIHGTLDIRNFVSDEDFLAAVLDLYAFRHGIITRSAAGFLGRGLVFLGDDAFLRFAACTLCDAFGHTLFAFGHFAGRRRGALLDLLLALGRLFRDALFGFAGGALGGAGFTLQWHGWN